MLRLSFNGTSGRQVKAKTKKKVRRKQERTEENLGAPLVPVLLRPHQAEALAAFDAGRRSQFLAWHRRAGKDWYGMYLAEREMQTNVGTYWHLLPKHIQAKRAIWNGIDHQSGKRFLELMFPNAVNINHTEMSVTHESGSMWQLLGSDNYDRMVGSNPRGVIFSEWALCDPMALEYIRPILRANGGWAIFITTFRGRNHAWQMYQNVKDNPDWYCTIKTVADTGLVSPEAIEADRREGMSERLIRQEYYCEPVPPDSIGPYSRAFESVDVAGNVRELPQSAIDNADAFIAAAVVEDYTAIVEASVRGDRIYIHHGDVARDVALHELLAKRTEPYRRAIFNVDDELLQDALKGLRANLRMRDRASTVETVSYLERCVVSPMSVVAAALNASIETWLDEEEPDADAATQAVLAALERLAALPYTKGWGPAPDYRLQDKMVIGHA